MGHRDLFQGTQADAPARGLRWLQREGGQVRCTLENGFEITIKPNESMGERGASACFQSLWDASEVDYVVTQGHEVWAVEVKSGRTGRLSGLSRPLSPFACAAGGQRWHPPPRLLRATTIRLLHHPPHEDSMIDD